MAPHGDALMTNPVRQVKISEHVLDLIGNTPLVRLRRVVEPRMATVLAKLESANPGGSVKDRISLAMVEDAEARGVLKPGATIVEPTSGNTGIGLAMVGAVKGYKVTLVMPETMTTERIQILKAYGAEVILTPAAEGMIGAVKRAEQLAKQTPGAFTPQQFINPANPEVHRRTTAQEILKATDGDVDAFVAGVGTGGTITGVGETLKKRNPALKVYAVEPKGSPVLSGGPPGQHMIQGIGAGFVPQVLNRSVIDEIIPVADEQAYDTSRRLSREEGLFVGISAGAACWAALKVASALGPGKTVLTVFPDTGERYVSIQSFFEG
jgi:cysteine synthase A